MTTEEIDAEIKGLQDTMTTEELVERAERAEAQAAVATGLLRRMKQRGESFGPDAAAAEVVLSADGGRRFVEDMGAKVKALQADLATALDSFKDYEKKLDDAWAATKTPVRGMVQLDEVVEKMRESQQELLAENKLLRSQVDSANKDLAEMEGWRKKSITLSLVLKEVRAELEELKVVRVGYQAKRQEAANLAEALAEAKALISAPDVLRLTSLPPPPKGPAQLEAFNTPSGRKWRAFRIIGPGQIEVLAEGHLKTTPESVGLVKCLRGLVEHNGLGDLIRKLKEAESFLATFDGSELGR